MLNKRFIKPLVLIITALLFSFHHSIWAASLLSTVDRNKIQLNETLVLTVQYDQKSDASALDFSALQNDFEVLGVSPQSNSSVTMINGKTTQIVQTKWTIVLSPSRLGALVIPALNIDGTQSQAIRINVTNKVEQGGATLPPLTADIRASSESVYPGQELILTVEISAQSDIGDLNGAPLELDNADTQALSQNGFRRVDNGIARQIVELKFSVFAKEPGELVIPRLTYSGVQGGRRSVFGSRGKQIIARTPRMVVDVKPIPDSTQDWFPVKNVSIRSEWSDNLTTAQVGSPITRTITVTAEGQRSSAIPPLASPSLSEDYKIYNDKPKLETEATPNGLISTRIESSAVVPSKEGNFTLPEIKVTWWNTQLESWQTSSLAAETITVAPSSSPVASVSSEPASDSGLNKPVNYVQSNHAASARIWQILCGVLLLICLVQYWALRKKKYHQDKDTDDGQASESEQQAWRKLRKALKQDDARSIRESIIVWGNHCLEGNVHFSLNALADQFGTETLQKALADLDQHLFNNRTTLDIDYLEKVLTETRTSFKSSKKKKNNDTDLQPLYPA